MAVRFHALSADDYGKIGNLVATPGNVDSYDTLTRQVIEYRDSDLERSTSSENVRSVIKLNTPVFNFVLGTSRCSVLKKILGVSKSVWDAIVDCTEIYDMRLKTLVPIAGVKRDTKYLIGAEIAKHFIDELDLDARRQECLMGALGSFLKQSANPYDVFKINSNGVGEPLTAGYFVEIDQEKLDDSMKRGRKKELWRSYFFESLFPNNDTAFSYLVNMPQDKSALYGMLNEYLVVVPESMRPSVERGTHKLTAAYTRVIKANFEYKAIRGALADVKDVVARYKALQREVSRLQYKNVDDPSTNAAKDDMSILERVKTKNGQIRKNNLGKRQDYSGRSVVCSNPFLPVDHLKIPNEMIPTLYEYHALPYLIKAMKENEKDKQENAEHVQTIYDNIRLTDLKDENAKRAINQIIDRYHILDKIPVLMGRQPTLHKQSIQGFHAERTNNHAIEVSPLVVTAYNMDFDGDQAWAAVYMSVMANKEINDLMITTQNIYLAKTGDSTIEPRQDMLYGLYMCTRSSYEVGKIVNKDIYETLEDIYNAVIMQRIRVDESVMCKEYPELLLAGEAAVMACYKKGDLLPSNASSTGSQMKVCEISKKTIGKYMEYLLRTDAYGNKVYPLGTGYAPNTTFVGVINRLVKLGFLVAEIYSASLTMITEETPAVRSAIDKFHEEMSDAYYYYGIGLETADNYKVEFDTALSRLNDAADVGNLGFYNDTNGYALLSKSGARGSKDNLKQAFVIKGRVKKNSTESFDALIENCYATQLSPMEQQINAFGGRQGQIDKSLKTGDTGYLMRKMWHATQGVSIVIEDCGATEGLKVSKRNLVALVRTPDVGGAEGKEIVDKEVHEIFVHALVGRYKVGSNKLITSYEAEQWASDDSIDTIEIRSPLKCKCMCCQKCYGLDSSLHKLAPIGELVGVIAAQSIGEPGSQLTLKQFQSGGVAGKAEFTSAFDKVDAYTTVSDLKAKQASGTYVGYDPLAWETGKVHEEPSPKLAYKKVSIGDSHTKIEVPKIEVLKQEVVKGEGISFKHGDYNLREILEISGIEAAQTYLVFKLFNLYKNEVKISLNHFEILAASMTRYMILSTDRSDLLVGQYCTAGDLYAGDTSKTEFIPKLISVDQLPQCSLDAMDNIIMENQSKGLSRACLLGLSDKLVKPINRMVLGMSIAQGSRVPGFVEARKEPIYSG